MSENSDSTDDSPRFSAKTIRKAILALNSILGYATVDALVNELEARGLPLTSDHETYSLAEIQIALEDIFGTESGSILLARLAKELFK